jgi:hypothetical protein
MLCLATATVLFQNQTGDSEKTLRAYYAKYLEETDIRRDLVQASVRESVERVRNQLNKHFVGDLSRPLKNEKAPGNPRA